MEEFKGQGHRDNKSQHTIKPVGENNSPSDSRVIKDKTQSDSELTSQGHGTQGQGQGEILDISLTCPSNWGMIGSLVTKIIQIRMSP